MEIEQTKSIPLGVDSLRDPLEQDDGFPAFAENAGLMPESSANDEWRAAHWEASSEGLSGFGRIRGRLLELIVHSAASERAVGEVCRTHRQ